MTMTAVATIRLDREDDERGTIRVGRTEEGWEVDCETPEGEIEEGSLPAFKTRQEALDAIHDSWGRDPLGLWDLRWID